MLWRPRTGSALAVCLLLLAVLAACRGPKGSPEASVKSYFSAANAQDYDAMVRTLAKESVAKIGSPEKTAAYLAYVFEGWSEFEVEVTDWSIAADEATATVKFSCKGMTIGQLDRKLHPGNCGDTYSLVKEADRKWHVILPETQKLRPM